MYRTSARPAPLDFLLPAAHSGVDIDHRKDVGYSQTLPQLPPVYLEAPIRDGLRTPPADAMATTYHPQYKFGTYNGQKDSAYPASAASTDYVPPYHAANVPAKPYSSMNQQSSTSISTSASTSRPEGHAQQHLQRHPPSPQRSSENALGTAEDTSRKSSSANDHIRPSLRIPSTISKDGGSLPDFAAQVWLKLHDVALSY
jgi:hypothetical protein